MLEGVLKVWHAASTGYRADSFNPWYVGGGVKRNRPAYYNGTVIRVSILGMLEGVLKVYWIWCVSLELSSFNPWYVGGGVKRAGKVPVSWTGTVFQSLVCWRGC